MICLPIYLSTYLPIYLSTDLTYPHPYILLASSRVSSSKT